MTLMSSTPPNLLWVNEESGKLPKFKHGNSTAIRSHVRRENAKYFKRKYKTERNREDVEGDWTPTPTTSIPKIGWQSNTSKRASRRPVSSELRTMHVSPTRGLFEQKDIMYFDLFRLRFVPSLASASVDFWSRVVIRETIRDDCVRFSALALGALSRALAQNSRGRPLFVPPFRSKKWSGRKTMSEELITALRYQTKALSLFRYRLANAVITKENLFINTMLFVVFELMQDHQPAAVSLIDNGIRLLRSAIGNPEGESQQAIKFTENLDYDITCIGHIFLRLSTFCISEGASTDFGFLPFNRDVRPLVMRPVPEIPDMNASTKKLFGFWGQLTAKINTFLARTFSARRAKEAEDEYEINKEQQEYISLLDRWKVRMELWAQTEKDPFLLLGIKRVQIHRRSFPIWLAIILDPTEEICDRYEEDFQMIVEETKILLERDKNICDETTWTQFSFDLGLETPLHLTILKCRNYNIRMAALESLSQEFRRQELKGANALIETRRELIELEERSRGSDGVIPLSSKYTLTGSEWKEENGKQKCISTYVKICPEKNDQPLVKELFVEEDD